MAELVRSSKSLSVHSSGTAKKNDQTKPLVRSSKGLSVLSSTATPQPKSIQTPELDAATGNTAEFVAPSQSDSVKVEEPKGLGDRLGNMVVGAGQQLLSSFTEAGRGIWDYLSDSYKYGETEESAKREDKVSPLLLNYADKQAAKSEGNIATAKQGLGTVGQFLVDAGVAGTQMAADVGIAALTGGAAVVPMMVRSFGSGVQDARNKGYGINQQMALGLGSAATEWATEKLFGGNPIYDKANSGVINKVIAKVTQNEDILKFLSSRPVETLNEGLEEILSGVINPAIELAVTGNADWPAVEELIRDGAIGVLLGGAGQVANSVANRKKSTAAETEEPVSPLIVQQEKKTETTPEQQEQMNPLADAIIGEQAQAATELKNPNDVVGQLQAGDKLVDENGNVVAEIKNVTEYGIAYVDSDGDVEQIPFNNPDGESIYETLGASNGHFERPDGTWVGRTQTTAEQSNSLADAIIGDGAPTAQPPAQPQTNPASPSGTFAEMQQQADKFHPINEEGAANAQTNYGRAPINVPVKNFDGHLTSKTASTMINSGITPDAVVQSFSDLLGRGEMSRIRFTDAEAVSRARRTIANKGWAKAVESFKADAAAGKRGKDLMALGIELFNNAATNGDVVAAADIAADIVEAAREQAQAIQVLNLFNKATPEGRFYFAVKGADNVVARMQQKYGDRAANIEVSQELLADYYEAVKSGDEQAIKESWQEVQKDIAAQIPPNWKDRLNAWRYLAMLGNPKTHIRNVAGNAAFMPVRMLKNTIGAGLEAKMGVKTRTKAVLDRSSANDRALLQMAHQDYEPTMSSQLAGKYDETGNEIDRQRQILPGALDTVSKKNTELLQKEDQWFSRPAYAQSMAGWLKANNITAQQFADMLNDQTPGVRKIENLRKLDVGETVEATDRNNFGKVLKDNGDGTYQVYFEAENGSTAEVKLDRTLLIPTRGKNGNASFDISEATPAEILAEARAYAVQEARKATYQDSNAFSDKIASFGKGDGIWSTAVSAVLPFKRTPANIIMRGVEYSPAYLIKGIHEMQTGVKSGKMSAAEAIDHIASGLTGTAIMTLGAMLAHFDILRASGDDDEKQAAFDKLRGEQNYALSFGDKSFTIDWLAPEALPLFVGTELYNWWMDRQEGGEATAQDFVESLMSLTDPILETSMLSSINDLIDSVGYSDNAVGSIINSVVTNYLSSFVPTIGGQIERTFGETERQETYRYNESNMLNASGQYDVANLLNKVPIPGADYGQIDYVDAWGRTQDQGNFLVRALNQFANPSYVSDDRTTEVDDELQRLYDAGQKAVLPQRRSQSDTIAVRDAEGNIIEERHLTAEEYEQYNRTKGQTSLELVSQFMDSPLYGSMNDDEKANAIGNIYSYAKGIADLEAEPTTKVASWVQKAMESSDPGKYIQLYSAGQNLEPWGDNKNPSAWQKVELVVKNANTEQADEFIPLYLEGNYPTKYEMARERGYSPERFVEAYTAMSTIESDRDENGESLGNVRKKVIAHLVSLGWPEKNATEMYKLLSNSTGKAELANWKW